MNTVAKLVLPVAALLCSATVANAGPIFLTGHDPDFHASSGLGFGGNLFGIGLSFVTGGLHTDSTKKFLWVQAGIAVPGGHTDPTVAVTGGLATLGLVEGTHYDVADGAALALVNFSDYEAIAVGSAFGGLFSRAELDALIGREADIATYINAGGGLFAAAECDDCGADLLGENPDLFGFVPLTGIVSVGAALPFTVTAIGASAPFNLTDDDVNDPTHNSFSSVPAALSILDTDAAGNATTIAGVVRIEDGVITPVPAPAALGLFALGLAGLLAAYKRRA